MADDPFRGNDARYRKVFAPYIPVEDGGLMPAGQREAMRNAMARTLAAQPPSRNIEDRTRPEYRQPPPAAPGGWLYNWLRGPQSFAGPSELGAEAGYFDVGNEPRPRGPR